MPGAFGGALNAGMIIHRTRGLTAGRRTMSDQSTGGTEPTDGGCAAPDCGRVTNLVRLSVNPSVETRTVKRGGCSTPRRTTTEHHLTDEGTIYLCETHLHLAGDLLQQLFVDEGSDQQRSGRAGQTAICCGVDLDPGESCDSCKTSHAYIVENGVECICGRYLLPVGAFRVDDEWRCPRHRSERTDATRGGEDDT